MGQTHGRHRRTTTDYADESMQVPVSGSPLSPGSPLTYSPQIAMEPLSKGDEFQRGGSVYGQSEFAGWAAQPKLVPTVLVWAHGGQTVQLEGSFDNWTQRHTMQQSGKDFTLVKLLPPGVYQYKFIVDGQWRHDPNLPCIMDDMGNINNVIEVQEYVPENLDGLSGFEPPPSPTASYDNPHPASEDFIKEPPIMPPQLQLSLLNVPPAMDAIAALPRPQHVILNHIYLQRATSSVNATVLGTTHRYRSKYVTTVMYKPRKPRVGGRTASSGHEAYQGGAGPSGSGMGGGGGGHALSPRSSSGYHQHHHSTPPASPMIG
ncbi:hypothetical protein N2152v2_004882 [Parachlorella kessleri]